jgi:hypothetical protein
MHATICACLIEFCGKNGAEPTAQELYDLAWPQYDRRVDWRCRPGRGPAEFMAKCVGTLQRFARGQIRGARTLEEAVASYRARKGAQADGQAGPSSAHTDGQAAGEEPQAGAAPEELAKPFILRDPRLIPRRQWLYGDVYIRSFVSVLASSGGAGKTTLYVAEALALVTNRALLGIQPAEATGVWLMNLEDPMDEMERRIAAAAIHFGVGQDDIAGRLFVDAGRRQPLVVAVQSRDGVTIHQPIVDAVVAQIRAKNIGLLVVDPFVASHGVNENDNQAINSVLALWRLIADLTGCCIVLIHHVRKPNGEEMTIDSVRGGSAIIGAVRTARVLNPMSEAEAVKLGIEPEQRRRYVRIDNAKNNLAPPAGKAQWIELTSVDLGNGLHGGDKVGVAAAWTPPDLWAGVRLEHLQAAHLYLMKNGPQPASTQHANWFGHRVAEILEMQPDAAGLARAKSVLDGWCKSGAIVKDRQRDARQGREVPVYVAGELRA